MKKKGGCMSQRSDDPPRDYIGTSQPTKDPPRDVKSGGQSSGSFDRSVAKRTSSLCVATRRDPIPFETGDKRKDPKSV